MKLGGILTSIKDSAGNELLDAPVHNRIVNSGMMSLLKVPENNASWYAAKDSDVTTYRTSYPNFDALYCYYGKCNDAYFFPHYGIASLLQCGTSSVETSDTMTSLVSPIDIGNLRSYGATKNLLYSSSYTNPVCMLTFTSSSVEERQTFTYVYLAPQNFTCREIGLFTPYPKVANPDKHTIFYPNLGFEMFARIVLPKSIQLIAGTAYTFTYSLILTKDYGTVWLQHDDIWGLETVMRKRYDIKSTGSNTITCYTYRCAIQDATILYADSESSFYGMFEKAVPSMALNYGACFPVASTMSNDNCRGVLSCPTIYWCSTVDGSYSSSVATYANTKGSTYYRATEDPVVKYQPDEIIQSSDTFRARSTYSYAKPFSDTTGTYPAIQWANWVWLPSVTYNSSTSITGIPFAYDNTHTYRITMDTVLERI